MNDKPTTPSTPPPEKMRMEFSREAILRGYAPRMLERKVDATATLCPAMAGCTFIGMFIDEDGDCWCVYDCSGSTVFVAC